MTPERWQKTKEIFQAALSRAPGERTVFVAELCGEDESLRKEVMSLLAAHEKDGSFIDSPALIASAEPLEPVHEFQKGQRIGRKLGVRAVLTGRITQHGDTVSIQTELSDVDANSQLWGEQYNRRLADLLAVQSEITSQIAEKLRLKLSLEEKKKLSRRQTENPEAYQLYLKGVYHAAKFDTKELDIGLGYLKQAVAVDPNYALAWHGLAYYYYLVMDWTMPTNEAMIRASEAAQRALAIDDTLATAHNDLGTVYFWYEWNWPAAEKEFKRAIELNPNDALTRELRLVSGDHRPH